jgi:hypothetical protein
MKAVRMLKKAVTLPPGEVARKARAKVEARAGLWIRGYRESRFTTYAVHPPSWLSRGLDRRVAGFRPSAAADDAERCRRLAERYLEHRFDLLGSGWVEVAYGTACAGTLGRRFPPGPAVAPDPEGAWLARIVNPANAEESARLWRGVSPGYRPIDWQLDFKSGFRYGAHAWHRRTGYVEVPGADIKVPWELSRMQHLPVLAAAFGFAAAGNPGFRPAEAYAREFQDQILDFIAANPPAYGVNWVCTMDVGIRVANWVVGRDLMLGAGARFPESFERALARSVLEHGRFIIRNLEWSDGLRGNHYLADIVGLLFAAAYLPSSPETDGWLLFSAREFIAEFGLQFGEDGGNFEASTCYHRLSAEMSVYATALLLGLPEGRLAALRSPTAAMAKGLPRFFVFGPLAFHAYPGAGERPVPPWMLERLAKAAGFIVSVLKPDGRMPQFGDNDSGRFLKIHQPFRAADEAPNASFPDAFREDILDLRHAVAAINGLFRVPGWERFSAGAEAETSLVSALARSGPYPFSADLATEPGRGRKMRAFPDFGLFVWRDERVYLAFRCGHIGQRDNGGHAHNDQLSFELCLDGRTLIQDIGTGVYTPDWDRRNRFRSTAAHNTLSIEGREQNRWENTRPGLFCLISASHARLLTAGDEGAEGEHSGFGVPHRRAVRLRERGVEGIDTCPAAEPREVHFHFGEGVDAAVDAEGVLLTAAGRPLARLRGGPGAWTIHGEEWSPAYGVFGRSQAARLRAQGDGPIKWYIEWPS